MIKKFIDSFKNNYLDFGPQHPAAHVVRLLRKLKSKLEGIIGYSFIEIGYAFNASIIILILFKFAFRLFGINPLWYINLLVLVLGVVFSLKYNFYMKIRKIIKKMWKGLIFSRSGYIMLDVFFFFIWIRLFIVSEIYTFVILNWLLIYFLIINKYFIVASLVSTFLLITKITFFIEEIKLQDVYSKLNIILTVNPGECYSPTWMNAQLIGIFNLRFCNEAENIDKQAFDSSFLLLRTIAISLLKLNPTFEYLLKILRYQEIGFDPKDGEPEFVEFCRQEIGFDTAEIYLQEKYREQIKTANELLQDPLNNLIAKKNQNKSFIFVIISIFFYILFQYPTDYTLMLNFYYINYQNFTNLLNKREVKEIIKVPVQEIHENLLKTAADPRTYNSIRASGHNEIWGFNMRDLFRFTQTTIRRGNPATFSKALTGKNNEGIALHGSGHSIRNFEHINFLKHNSVRPPKEVIEALEKNTITVSHLDIRDQYFTTETEFKELNNILDPHRAITDRIQPQVLTTISNLVCDSSASKEEVKSALAAEYNFFEAMVNHKSLPASQKYYFKEGLVLIKRKRELMLNKIDQIEGYAKDANPIFEQEIALLNAITVNIEANPQISPIKTMVLTIKKSKNISLQQAQSECKNLDKIKRAEGGANYLQEKPNGNSEEEFEITWHLKFNDVIKETPLENTEIKNSNEKFLNEPPDDFTD